MLIRTGPAADPLLFADAVQRCSAYRIAGLVTLVDPAMRQGIHASFMLLFIMLYLHVFFITVILLLSSEVVLSRAISVWRFLGPATGSGYDSIGLQGLRQGC